MSLPTIPDDYGDDHALLVGKVAMAWNDACYSVYWLFETITGTRMAWSIFWTLKADSAQRDITLAAASWLLAKQPTLLGAIKSTLKELGTLAGQRNAIIHTPWGATFKDTDGKLVSEWDFGEPAPLLKPASLQPDFKTQCAEVEAKLNAISKRLIGINRELERRLSSLDKDPRRKRLPKASPRETAPQTPPENSEPPPQSSET